MVETASNTGCLTTETKDFIGLLSDTVKCANLRCLSSDIYLEENLTHTHTRITKENAKQKLDLTPSYFKYNLNF